MTQFSLPIKSVNRSNANKYSGAKSANQRNTPEHHNPNDPIWQYATWLVASHQQLIHGSPSHPPSTPAPPPSTPCTSAASSVYSSEYDSSSMLCNYSDSDNSSINTLIDEREQPYKALVDTSLFPNLVNPTTKDLLFIKQLEINDMVVAANNKHSEKQKVIKQFNNSSDVHGDENDDDYKFANTFSFCSSKRAAFKRLVAKIKGSKMLKPFTHTNDKNNTSHKSLHNRKHNYDHDAFRKSMAELVCLEYADQLETFKGLY